MVALTYTDADDVVTDLNDSTKFFLEAIRGAGIAGLRHDTVETPSRDGETYVRTILEPRFLIVQLIVQGTDWAAHLANRRTLITALNPKTGVGTLKWTPDATLYAIDCIVEQGADFSKQSGGPRQRAIISFRCPDPTWYDPVQASDTIINTGSGLSVPITIPLTFVDGKGTTVINNLGDVDSLPTITVPGACTNPVITNTTTNKKLKFVGLTIAGGQTLTVDADARTAKVGGTSVIDKLSSDSEFWPLASGNNTVTFAIDSGTVTATVKYVTRFLGV